MTIDLNVLAKNRDALLLAEVAALLHDIGKCTSEFAYFPEARSAEINKKELDPYKAIFAPNELSKYKFSQQRIQERIDEANLQYALHKLLDKCVLAALDKEFTIENVPYSFREAIYFSRPRFATRIYGALGRNGEPLDLLANCHGEAHVEKEDPSPSIIPKPVARYSAFGHLLENLPRPDKVESLTKNLNSLNWEAILRRDLEELRSLLQKALGDTRFPINEVTLWDWSYTVASIYKSELAYHYITGQWRLRPHLRWRLLRVNFDVLGLYAKAVKIGDLLGYKRAVEQACEAVKKLIEEDYPLGNEIYRDSTGIYFTFPDLDLPADLAQEIRSCVEEVEMELAPRIAVTVGEGKTATEQLKSILGKAHEKAQQELQQPFDAMNLNRYWQDKWEEAQRKSGNWEVCPVCRLRPMQEGAKRCETCEKRRGSRIKTWEKNPAQTIWMDEIADHNGRVALIVGKFGLDDWLSGDLVQTMLVRAVKNAPEQCTPKNPSPARLRRVWETCQRFWTETVEQEILSRHGYDKGDPLRCVRRLIIPDQKTGWRENVPYDGTVDGKAISLLWRARAQYFLTISNLQLSGEIKPGHLIRLDDPDNPRRQFTITVRETRSMSDPMGTYAPYLPLLASPDQFLTLVPAADALEIAEKIRAEYAKQFGKVQNRLPLFLGLVFFQRKTPLMAVMDTARRMLASEFANGEWRITNAPQNDGKTVTLNLEQNGQCITLQVPLVMGDGTTEDVWYPYFELVGQPAAHHTYRFERDGAWWVHVKTLQAGETVRITPSRFAYLFLESTAQRFRFDPEKDVLLLDELPRLMKMWDALKQSGITDTGLRNVQVLLESKSAAWGRDSEEFKHLMRTTLKEAGLFDRKDREDNPLPDVITPEDVTSGRFAHCLELHLHILKLKLKEG